MYQVQETLGQYLKREREAHRVPVEEIALFLGVNRSFIDALERDDFDLFIRRRECVRLVKQYTAYLKLNQPEVLRLCEAGWKVAGGMKRYPKLTQFTDGTSSPLTRALFKFKRLLTGHLPSRRVWLSVAAGALIVIAAVFIDLPGTKREPALPDQPQLAENAKAVDLLPAGERVTLPAADAEGQSASPSRVSRPESPLPGPGRAEGNIPPSAKGVRVIGNRDSKRYHLPGMKYYDQVKAHHRVVFPSEKEALRAGYRKARE